MRPAVFIVPAATLLLASIWLDRQQESLHVAEEQLSSLQALIRTHEHAATTATSHSPAVIASSSPVDWEKIATRLRSIPWRDKFPLEHDKLLDKHLEAMSVEDLVAGLEQLEKLDLPPVSTGRLSDRITAFLAAKDPEAVLGAFRMSLGDEQSPLRWQALSVMKTWMRDDPVAAMAWLDREIAAGTLNANSFQEFSQIRGEFERLAVMSLIPRDARGVRERLLALPMELRAGVLLADGPEEFTLDERVDIARIIRATMPEEIQTEAIAHQASRLVGTDFQAVEIYLERIQATPEERAEVVEVASLAKARRIFKEDGVGLTEIENLRGWIRKHSPGAEERVTGMIIATAYGARRRHDHSFSEAVDFVEKFHRSTGDDEVLLGFLEHVVEPAGSLRGLAEKIQDPAVRQKWLDQVR